MAIATTVRKIDAKKSTGPSWTDRLSSFNTESLFQGKVAARDLIFFTNQLALMQEIGTPLNESLSVISKQIKNPAFKKIADALLAEVEDGTQLSKALGKYPKTFSPEYISLVNAGEDSGHLHEMLNRSMELMEKREKFKTTLKSSLTYPMVLCTVTIAVVIFMLAFVFPRFTILFEGVEEILPPTTRFLMVLSHYIRVYWHLIIMAAALLWFGIMQFLKTTQGRLLTDRLKISIPVLSDIYIKIYLSQLMRTMGFLLGSSVPLMETLAIAGRGTSNLFFSRFVDKITENVEGGKGISPAFSQTSFIPETVSQMVKTGEASQKVDRVMLRLSDYYDGEIEVQVKRFTTIIEPVLLILMGIVVGVIVISLILPIFKLSKVVN